MKKARRRSGQSGQGVSTMDSTSTDGANARKVTATAADLVKEMTPERLAAHEAAYRRGVHQAFAMAGDIAAGALTLGEARRSIRRAETLAGTDRLKMTPFRAV